jgi:heptaprenyl diphosphate synthase
MQPEERLSKIALLIALACILQISESLIPHPIPGLRLGLANMLTLTAMVVLGFGYALEVAVLRTVLSSLIMGTFMSPTFILSLGGAVVSTLVMGFFYWLSGLSRYSRLSIIGISIIGAFVHNLVQLNLAYLLLVKHAGIFVFLPWLSIGSVATGWVVGVVAGGVCQRLQGNFAGIKIEDIGGAAGTLQMRLYAPADSWLHGLPAAIKMVGLFLMALALLVFPNVEIHIACFLFLCVLLLISRTPLKFMISAAFKYKTLVLISFLLPLFFNSGTHVIADAGFFKLTYEGLRTGALFAARILLLVMSSALLLRTTSPAALVDGLGRLLRPLGLFGISAHRIAALLSMAWTALPQLWKTTRDAMASLNPKNIKNLRGLLPLLSNLIATLYLKTEPGNSLWNPSAGADKSDSPDSCTAP